VNILAIDFGGTRIRTAWYANARPDTLLVATAQTETSTLAYQPQDEVLARVIETGRRVVPPGCMPDAIGMAAPGPLNPRTGVIYHAETLPGWQNIRLAQIISEAFGSVPVAIENDANLGALAESKLGAGRGADPMLYLTLSTGIGGGAVMGGRLYTGWSGLAIEPGHMRFTDTNGHVQRLEAIASGTALGQRACERLAAGETSILGNIERVDGAAVGRAAQTGDALALAVVREAGFFLGLGIVNLLHLFSPQAIVVGGSVTQLGDLLFTPMWEAVHAHVLDPLFIPPDLIRPAALGDEVCLTGAVLLALGARETST
jgi:glucokinase